MPQLPKEKEVAPSIFRNHVYELNIQWLPQMTKEKALNTMIFTNSSVVLKT